MPLFIGNSRKASDEVGRGPTTTAAIYRREEAVPLKKKTILPPPRFP